jgi:hypothetical protein
MSSQAGGHTTPLPQNPTPCDNVIVNNWLRNPAGSNPYRLAAQIDPQGAKPVRHARLSAVIAQAIAVETASSNQLVVTGVI